MNAYEKTMPVEPIEIQSTQVAGRHLWIIANNLMQRIQTGEPFEITLIKNDDGRYPCVTQTIIFCISTPADSHSTLIKFLLDVACSFRAHINEKAKNIIQLVQRINWYSLMYFALGAGQCFQHLNMPTDIQKSICGYLVSPYEIPNLAFESDRILRSNILSAYGLFSSFLLADTVGENPNHQYEAYVYDLEHKAWSTHLRKLEEIIESLVHIRDEYSPLAITNSKQNKLNQLSFFIDTVKTDLKEGELLTKKELTLRIKALTAKMPKGRMKQALEALKLSVVKTPGKVSMSSCLRL